MPSDLEISAYYNSYWVGKEEDDLLPLFASQARARLNFFSKYLPVAPTLDVLDIGAGYGLIGNIFPRKINYDAVEVDPSAIKYLQQNISPRKVYADSCEVSGKYHVIILAHILEHFKDPLSFLLKQKNLLSNGGVLFVEVPNMDFRFKTRNEPHLIFFDIKTILDMVTAAGFSVLRIDTCGEQIESMMRGSRKSIINSLLKKALKSTKDVARKILPARTLHMIMKARTQRVNELASSYAESYGGERRWIRLVATKK